MMELMELNVTPQELESMIEHGMSLCSIGKRLGCNPNTVCRRLTEYRIGAVPLDMGKVGALYRAGWSVDAIAEEMGWYPEYIRRHLHEVPA